MAFRSHEQRRLAIGSTGGTRIPAPPSSDFARLANAQPYTQLARVAQAPVRHAAPAQAAWWKAGLGRGQHRAAWHARNDAAAGVCAARRVRLVDSSVSVGGQDCRCRMGRGRRRPDWRRSSAAIEVMEGPDTLPSVGNRAWQPRVVLVLPLLRPCFWVLICRPQLYAVFFVYFETVSAIAGGSDVSAASELNPAANLATKAANLRK
ncbi:hypothetical protein L1887_47079 [Cichorium endivia]|nr:hypothetical protein L1887_47079 [Cichorium endivia]